MKIIAGLLFPVYLPRDFDIENSQRLLQNHIHLQYQNNETFDYVILWCLYYPSAVWFNLMDNFMYVNLM